MVVEAVDAVDDARIVARPDLHRCARALRARPRPRPADPLSDARCRPVAEVRGLHGRVNLLIALVLLVLGVLVQVAFRLD